MKLKKVPKKLSNLPLGYQLDIDDKYTIKKYRDDKKKKMRQENRIKFMEE